MFEDENGIQTTKVKISAREFYSHVTFLMVIGIAAIVFSSTTILEDTVGSFDWNALFGKLDGAIDQTFDKIEKSVVSKNKNDHWQKQMDCHFYVAPSFIPNTGYGLYTGKDMDANEPIVIGSGETFHWSTQDFADLFLHMKHNVYSNVKVVKTDKEGVYSFVTSQPVSETKELFFNIHELEELQEGSLELYQQFYPKAPIRKESYDEADRIIKQTSTYITSTQGEIANVIKGRGFQSPLYNSNVLRLVKHTVSLYDVAASNLLPDSFEEWTEASRIGIAKTFSPDRRIYWLYKHGYCLDPLTILQPSTIDKKQKGLFIQKDIAKGRVIMETPLQVFPYSDHFNKSFIDHCFKPTQMDMLLCPLVFSGFMNHAFSSSTCGENDQTKNCQDGANADYLWINDVSFSTKLGKTTAEKIYQGKSIELVIRFIAKRNIQAGEELTIDYGSIWKEALDHHQATGLDSNSFHHPMDFKKRLIPSIWKKESSK